MTNKLRIKNGFIWKINRKLLAEGFYKYAFEQGHIDELLCQEAGAKKRSIT